MPDAWTPLALYAHDVRCVVLNLLDNAVHDRPAECLGVCQRRSRSAAREVHMLLAFSTSLAQVLSDLDTVFSTHFTSLVSRGQRHCP